jgi:hypothetical protein
VEGEPTLDDPVVARRDAAIGQGLKKPFLPQAARAVVRVARDKADINMTEVQQVFGHRPRRGPVVHADPGRATLLPIRRDPDIRRAEGLQD